VRQILISIQRILSRLLERVGLFHSGFRESCFEAMGCHSLHGKLAKIVGPIGMMMLRIFISQRRGSMGFACIPIPVCCITTFVFSQLRLPNSRELHWSAVAFHFSEEITFYSVAAHIQQY
jgi:hypothetical protein